MRRVSAVIGFSEAGRRFISSAGVVGLSISCGLLGSMAMPSTVLADDVEVFDEHITILASPFMEGRLPGTKGMEMAKDYVEYYFKQYGLLPAFSNGATGEKSFRQPFELGSSNEMVGQRLEVHSSSGTTTLKAGSDYSLTSMGIGGDVAGDLVFVGYSVDDGPDGYNSFGEGDDLTGKIAVMLRFEPMDEEGRSKWATRGPWSAAAGFNVKIRAVAKRNPAAVLLVNTPGANDRRINQLVTDGVQMSDDFPIFMMSMEGGDKLVRAADSKGRSLADLRDIANESGGVIALNKAEVSLAGSIERKPVFAENVGGLLPGKGNLKDEYIVVGAHLDHLGMGEFGSRSGPGELHPGADDNASGVVAVMMMAESLSSEYADLDDNANRRSVVFIGFSAEESGLNGSQHYVSEPIAPIEDHAFMINFDMIGRIVNNELRISGTGSADGIEEWLEPIAEKSELTVLMSERSIGGSDHLPFMRRNIPFIFGSINGLHDDYHTPNDTHQKINREGGAMTAKLFSDILSSAASRPERFQFASANNGQGGRGGAGGGGGFMSRLKVRLGIRPDQNSGEGEGIVIGSVTEGGTADEGGMMAGDVLVMWNKEDVEDMQGLLLLMAEHEPGEKVRVKVIRDGEEQWLELTLQGRG